jgi:hypothetical protein
MSISLHFGRHRRRASDVDCWAHYDTLMKTRRTLSLFALLATLIASGTSAPGEESASGVGSALGSGTISGYVDSSVGAGAHAKRKARPTEQSGVVVHAWYPGYCVFDPPAAPWCELPRPYYGTFSIFTKSGRYVTSASTAEDITATFTTHLRPGRYVIVPDDPDLMDAATVVTVRARQLTDVTIWITEE